jgi:hypothetical protein
MLAPLATFSKLTLCAVIAAGCGVLATTSYADAKRDRMVTVKLDDSPESEWKLQDISDFAAAVRGADSVVILEGLPYPAAEKEWYDHESKRKDLSWIHDYPFYRHPLKISDQDLREVKEILLDPGAHLEFPKFMPSLLTEDFHPNYTVVWSKRGLQVGSLMDLSCRCEWKNFTQVLYGRIAHEPYAKLSKILGKYHQNLPAAVADPSITAAIPASILSRTVTESNWRSFYDNLCSEMAKWHTPTHEPELVETFWDPIFYLKPSYYFIDGENLGEIEICDGIWFAAYRGKRVSELVAIGCANRTEYKKNPLGIADAVRLCLAANWSNGCHTYLAVNQGMGSISFPGLNQLQVDSLAAADFRVILDDHMSFVVDDERHTAAKRRSSVVKFMELYNPALFEKAASKGPTAGTPVALPASEAGATPR